MEDPGFARRVNSDSALLTRKGMTASNETAMRSNQGDVEGAIEKTGVSVALVPLTMSIERLKAEKRTFVESGDPTEEKHAKAVEMIKRAGDAIYAFGQRESRETPDESPGRRAYVQQP